MRAQAPDPCPGRTMMRFYNEQRRFYCGVDLHARTVYLCILNASGQVVPPRAETSVGTSPVQQTRKSQQPATSYARKKSNLLNSAVPLFTREAINGFGEAAV